MSDFPPQWSYVRDLPEGGQGHTFVVRRTNASDNKLYVLKRLKNLKRKDYFDREIQVCKSLEHPNVLKVIESGETPKGKPYLITEYCDGGSLADATACSTPLDGLRLFERIVSGVAQAHSNEPAIFHLDLKPENILLKADVPVVGDFGICFVDDDEVSMTKEGPRGSIYYCAPELRNPKITERTPLKAADVYSLGKILYFIFTNDVYDGHEEEYGNDPRRLLTTLFPEHPQFALVDELVSATVQRKPTDRLPDAIQFLRRVSRVIDRIESGGRVLDLRIPQRCLYCAEGTYRPAHEQTLDSRGRAPVDKFPRIEERRVS